MKAKFKLIITVLTSLFLLSACVVHDSHRHHRGKKVIVKKHKTVKVVTVPRSARVVVHSGHNYYIHNGRFYRAHKRGHVIAKPPVGLTLTVLPSGFVKIKRNGRWVYHHEGVFLRWNAKKKIYVVID